MKKFIFGIILGIFVLPLLFSCSSGPEKVNYKLAKGYFVRNDVEGRVPATISSQSLFDECFGAAAVMGEEGVPTPIDFSKKSVITLDLGEKTVSTVMEVVGVDLPEANRIRVLYKVKEGEPISYSERPCAIVIVDKKYDGYDLELKLTE